MFLCIRANCLELKGLFSKGQNWYVLGRFECPELSLVSIQFLCLVLSFSTFCFVCPLWLYSCAFFVLFFFFVQTIRRIQDQRSINLCDEAQVQEACFEFPIAKYIKNLYTWLFEQSFNINGNIQLTEFIKSITRGHTPHCNDTNCHIENVT